MRSHLKRDVESELNESRVACDQSLDYLCQPCGLIQTNSIADGPKAIVSVYESGFALCGRVRYTYDVLRFWRRQDFLGFLGGAFCPYISSTMPLGSHPVAVVDSAQSEGEIVPNLVRTWKSKSIS